MSLIWLSVSSGATVLEYVLAVMMATPKTSEGRALHLVAEIPACYISSTAQDQTRDVWPDGCTSHRESTGSEPIT